MQGGVFCMVMVGQGGWFHNGWVDKCRGPSSDSSWEGILPQAMGVKGGVHPDISSDTLTFS